MSEIPASQTSPWLDYEGAAQRLAERFNVELSPDTIRNKVGAGEIQSKKVAGKRRIHSDWLDAWALGEPVEAA